MPAGLTTPCLTFRDIFVCTQHPYLWCSPTQASQLTLAFKRGVATLDGGSTLIYGLFQKSRVLAQDGVQSAVEGAKIGLNETSGGSRRSYLLKAGTPSLFNRAATSAPALCVLTLLSM